MRRIWQIDKRNHTTLCFIPLINTCFPHDLLLEKRCIKFIWNLTDLVNYITR